jgi:peroxiredoxin
MMMPRPKSGIVPLVALALGVLGGAAAAADPGAGAGRKTPEASRVQVGEGAPDFEVTTTDGKKFKLSEQRGKVVLITFFATWCGPCRTEMPHLQQEVFEKIKGGRFTMIALGREHDSAEVARFKEKNHLGFPMAADPKRAVFGLYAERLIPRNVVVGRDGRVLFQSVGYDEKEFKALKALLREQAEGRAK